MSQFVRNVLGAEFRSSDQVMPLDLPLDLDMKSQNHSNNNNGNNNNNNNDNRNNNNGKQNRRSIFEISPSSAFIPFENEAVQFWKVFFDFAYFTLLSPFRFIWDPDTGYYICHTSKMQRVLQWTLCICTTCYFLFRLQAMSKWDPDEHPTLYFDLAYYFFDTTFLVLLFLLFGSQKRLVDEVFRELQHHNKIYYRFATNSRKRLRQATLICIGCLSTLGLQILETLLDQNWDFGQFIQFWEDDAGWVFHHRSITNLAPFIFGCLACTSSLFEKLMNAFSDILFTLTVLMFDTLVNSFEDDMDSSRREMQSNTRVLEHYHWLKYIVGKINSAMNLITGAFIAGNLPFYATNVFEVFGDGNIFMRLRYICYCSYWFPTLFIAANANRKIDNVRYWVTKEPNYTRIPVLKLNVFLHELDFSTIGMSSFGVIVVTWHSVGSIISVILTYALMKSQFKAAAEEAAEGGVGDLFRNLTSGLAPEN